MTNERLLEIINDREKCKFCPDCGDDAVCIQCERVKGIAASELREYYSRLRELAPPLTPPQPLTLEELRGMDGKPVYIVYNKDGDGMWRVFHQMENSFGAESGTGEYARFEDGSSIEGWRYAETWLAYPAEPGREP